MRNLVKIYFRIVFKHEYSLAKGILNVNKKLIIVYIIQNTGIFNYYVHTKIIIFLLVRICVIY